MTTLLDLLILAATIAAFLTIGVLLHKWQEHQADRRWARGMRNDHGVRDGETRT